MLLENKIQNDDRFNMAMVFDYETKLTYNLESLMKSRDVPVDPELISSTPAALLTYSRLKCEVKLIKAKIVFKVYQGLELSQNESKYLKEWVM